MAFGFSRFYTRGGHAIRPEPGHYIKLPGVKTFVWTDSERNTHIKLHRTNVVSFNDNWITLRTDGWKTQMTKARMNWAGENYELGFYVDSRRVHGETEWYVEFKGAWPFNKETISLNRKTMEMVEKDMVPESYDSDLEHCKRQRSRNPSSSDAIDVEVSEEGNIIMFELRTNEAKEWWSGNIKDAQKFGGRYAVEHRYAGSVIEGMMADGLNVR